GGPAAASGHAPGLGRAPAPPHAGRALARAGPAAREGDLPHHPRAQGRRRHHPARRAERQAGAAGGRPRLYPRDGPDRARGAGRRAPARRGRAARLPGRRRLTGRARAAGRLRIAGRGGASMRSGAEYGAALRDGRAVLREGERVEDPSKHPAFAAPIRRIAETYDLARAAAAREATTFVDEATGARHSAMWLVPRTAADLGARRRAHRLWAEP